MDENKVLNEEKRLIDILDRCGVSDRDRDVLAPVIDNLAWMAAKLDETRKEIGFEAVAIPYDNGGGQTGIRENPEFVAFEKLMASYTKSLRQLTEIVEKGSPSQKTIGVLKELSVIADKKAG